MRSNTFEGVKKEKLFFGVSGKIKRDERVEVKKEIKDVKVPRE